MQARASASDLVKKLDQRPGLQRLPILILAKVRVRIDHDRLRRQQLPHLGDNRLKRCLELHPTILACGIPVPSPAASERPVQARAPGRDPCGRPIQARPGAQSRPEPIGYH